MVVIIDYGMGNLKSVYNALKKIECDCKISSDIEDIRKADKLILPGVGAFKDAMDNLEKMNLIPIINKKVNEGCPLLGICLGMQMLFEEGYEGQPRKGLGFIEGEVKLIEPNEEVKIPHIGGTPYSKYNVQFDKESLKYTLNKESFVYYVHSFMSTNMSEDNLIAYSEYGGINIPGMVNKRNIYGAQFHPEKSGEVGLRILKNFGELIV